MNITNDKVTEYLYAKYRPLTAGLAELRASAEERRVPIILRDTEMLLGSLLGIVRPASVLEIGSAVGYSALFFAESCPEAKIVTLEREEALYRECVRNIDKNGCTGRISALKGDACALLDDMIASGSASPFDFVFIDASKSHYREFWDRAIRLCRPGSVIVCDNILMKAKTVSDEYDPEGRYRTNIRRMREFADHITDCEEAATSINQVGDGISISIVR